MCRSSWFVIILVILLLFGSSAAAGTGSETSAETAAKKARTMDVAGAAAVLPKRMSTTSHVLKAGETAFHYRATAGSLPVRAGRDESECRIFFIGYEIESERQVPRPLTFVFNGGPGASSAYLHLAALGPRCIMINEDGSLPAQPARLFENPHTWLRYTDLVFVDPVGTGYSRCVCKEKDNEGQTKASTWGVREDLISLAKFIRLYLTREQRWLSPKFLVGESYGGFRVAALSQLLQSDYGIALNGVILVSPALEFGLLRGENYSLLPWVVSLPSYAAAARHHGKAPEEFAPGTTPREALKEVEHFALRTVLPALAEGTAESLSHPIASYIGLPERRVARLRGRISATIFVKELLRDSRRLVSLYDASWSAIDPDPASPFPPGEDPLLIQLSAHLTAALNSYVREDLEFETDIPYEVLNKEAARKWNWRSGLDGEQGFVGVAKNLKKAMSTNEELRVFVGHGVLDLVTPYFASVVVIRQMALDPAVGSNLSLKLYPGGHMFYTHRAGRLRFFEEGKTFIKSAVPRQ